MSFRASRRLRSTLLLLVLTLVGAPLAAQPWRGTAALALELGQRERGAAALEVRLQFLDIEPKVGPEALVPSADGKLEVGGLAEGKWLLEVRAGGKSAYSAVIQVEAGKKATVVAGPVRDAAAPSVSVKLVKASGRATPPPQGQVPTTPPPAPRTAPPPAAKPAPTPSPTPATPRDPPTTPAPTPTVPTPPPAAAPAPSPTPTPPRPTSFAGAPIRSQKDGSCAECKAGEWAVSAQAAAGPQTEASPPGKAGECALAAAFRAQLQAAAGRFDAGFGRYVGPFLDPVTGAWVAATGVASPAALGAPGASCQLLALVLPKGARYKGYAYEASEVGRTGACIGDQPCEIGAARFLGHPETEKVGEATVIFGVFENTSAERERRAKLIVYFSHPDPGWKPPAP
jgi:outer membrane biosynthesis protein TonB